MNAPAPVGDRPAGDRRARFRPLWIGESASWAGSALHAVALPVIAVSDLSAGPGQVAALAALATAPAFLLALPAGVLGDRRPKRRVMLATDLAAAAVVAVIPLCWTAGVLSMTVLYAAAFTLGSLTVLHQAAAIAIVRELVGADHLTVANSRMVASYAAADAAGTYGGTALVGAAGAARAMMLDSLSYLISAWCAWRLPRTTPAAPAGPSGGEGTLSAIREGFGFVLRHPLLGPQAVALALHGFAFGIITTYSAYWLLTELNAGTTGLGLVMGAAGTGGLAGALAAPRLQRRHGPGPVILYGFAVYPLHGALLLAARPGPVWLGVLIVAGAAQAIAVTAAGATQRTLRQHLTPTGLQSRAQQTAMWLTSGVRPVAAVAAGAVAAAVGVRAALTAGVVLLVVPVIRLWASPVRTLTAMPVPTGSGPVPAVRPVTSGVRAPAAHGGAGRRGFSGPGGGPVPTRRAWLVSPLAGVLTTAAGAGLLTSGCGFAGGARPVVLLFVPLLLASTVWWAAATIAVAPDRPVLALFIGLVGSLLLLWAVAALAYPSGCGPSPYGWSGWLTGFRPAALDGLGLAAANGA
ncbi:MFS transporter [Streptomyces sp. CAU 1734]